ncbi:MAG: histidine triad nucleotide-binding protein [Pseudomonadota bacterium]|nr:histidine triad nucleotide-binding protein [Pseudomonadota bacterium]
MMTDSIFQKIIDKEIPAEILFEDDKCLVFKDINPIAPIHVLIIPKKPIEKISDSKKEDTELLGYLLLKAGDIARELGVEEAFRLVVNNGAGAQQTVFHLHIHLIAGREFSWPPG